MNFTSQSLKPDLKPQNEDFFFERETQRGHFFAVLDFDQHDFPNLSTTLEAKLETILKSFETLSGYSAQLFLGFIAKEINNFLHSFGQRSDQQELLCNAALCLVSGKQFSYFTCGDTSMVLITQKRLVPLVGIEAGEVDQGEQSAPKLGQPEKGTSFTDQVQYLTLNEGDIVLMMTSGIAGGFEAQTLFDPVLSSGSLEPEMIRDRLMEASEGSQEDRTLVVIGGPYERYAEPVTGNLNEEVASSEQWPDPLNENTETTETTETTGSGGLPANITIHDDRLLELEQKVENLTVVLANKADTVDVLALQSEVLKLGALAKERSALEGDTPRQSVPAQEGPEAVARLTADSRPFIWIPLLFLVGIAGGFIGGWVHASGPGKVVEAWTVKAAGNQIMISRLNSAGSPSIVTIDTARPLNSPGEQNFSSFADVKKYIDTITPSEFPVKVEQVESEPRTASQSQPKPTPPPPSKEPKSAEIVTSIAFRQGDSLKSLAQRHKVPPARLIALNPKIIRWSQVKNGQRVVVPAGPVNNRAVSQQLEQSSRRRPSKTATRLITVEAGDTLDRLARRNNLSPSRLKELNPKITNWSRIQPGQKVLVPTPVRG